MAENQVCCPKCGSTQIHAEKRGWGLMTGFIGARKVYITCLACGKRFSPGEGKAPREESDEDRKIRVENLIEENTFSTLDKRVAIGAAIVFFILWIMSR
jgi:predicted RNA-binding Zn-ribbon protein involved in translation (DUF1610 family)